MAQALSLAVWDLPLAHRRKEELVALSARAPWGRWGGVGCALRGLHLQSRLRAVVRYLGIG